MDLSTMPTLTSKIVAHLKKCLVKESKNIEEVKIFRIIKEQFLNDHKAEDALENFIEDPIKYKVVFVKVLKEKLQKDSEFLKNVQGILEEL